MNTRQEIVDALNGEHEGMAPPAVFTQTATFEDMQASGASFPEANFTRAVMEKLSLQMHDRHGFATARVPFCITVEAERLGGFIQDGGDKSQPSARGSPYMSHDPVGGPVLDVPELMDPLEFINGGRCAMLLDILKGFRLGHQDLFTTAGILDPSGIAGALNGYENFLMAYFLDPDANKKWVDAMVPYSCAYAGALSEYADNVMVVTAGSSDLVPPECFDEIVGGPDRRVFASVHGFSMCHSCGDTAAVQEKLACLGETMLSVETKTDPEGIFQKLHGKVKLVGGIDPVSILMSGTPEMIRCNARHYDAIGYDAIVPECGVPPVTPGANLDALSGYRSD